MESSDFSNTKYPAVAESVAKTGRCVIVHEAPVTAGAGAEISAHLQQACFLNLEVRRSTNHSICIAN